MSGELYNSDYSQKISHYKTNNQRQKRHSQPSQFFFQFNSSLQTPQHFQSQQQNQDQDQIFSQQNQLDNNFTYQKRHSNINSLIIPTSQKIENVGNALNIKSRSRHGYSHSQIINSQINQNSNNQNQHQFTNSPSNSMDNNNKNYKNVNQIQNTKIFVNSDQNSLNSYQQNAGAQNYAKNYFNLDGEIPKRKSQTLQFQLLNKLEQQILAQNKEQELNQIKSQRMTISQKLDTNSQIMSQSQNVNVNQNQNLRSAASASILKNGNQSVQLVQEVLENQQNQLQQNNNKRRVRKSIFKDGFNISNGLNFASDNNLIKNHNIQNNNLDNNLDNNISPIKKLKINLKNKNIYNISGDNNINNNSHLQSSETLETGNSFRNNINNNFLDSPVDSKRSYKIDQNNLLANNVKEGNSQSSLSKYSKTLHFQQGRQQKINQIRPLNESNNNLLHLASYSNSNTSQQNSNSTKETAVQQNLSTVSSEILNQEYQNQIQLSGQQKKKRRYDSRGVIILPNSKNHKIKFLDKDNLVKVNVVENWKKLNKVNENYMKKFKQLKQTNDKKSCCLFF